MIFPHGEIMESIQRHDPEIDGLPRTVDHLIRREIGGDPFFPAEIELRNFRHCQRQPQQSSGGNACGQYQFRFLHCHTLSLVVSRVMTRQKLIY